MQLSIAFLQSVLAMLKLDGADAVDGTLTGAKVALFTNEPVLSPDTVWGDLEEATFTGYSRSAAITWADAILSSQTNLPVIYGDAKTFLCTDDAPAETVYGYAIVSGATPPVLLASALLETPEAMQDGHGLIIVPRVGFNSVAEIPDGAVTLT